MSKVRLGVSCRNKLTKFVKSILSRYGLVFMRIGRGNDFY
jgi:hypothetical protein